MDNAINDFDAMNLNEDVLRGIYLNNIISPTNVQKLAIQPIIEGKDTFVVAKEWSGKTVAFCIGILNSIDPELHKTQSIILLPTHGIAYRTYNIMKSLAEKFNISIELFIGGHDINEDIEKASKEPLITIGTPGRILDLIRKNKLKFKFLKIICIKWFELYLDNLKTVDIIFQYIPIDSQKLFFTTIFNNKLHEFMNKFMNEPIKIKADLQPTKYNVEQLYISYFRITNKLNLIDYILLTRNLGRQYIIFANTIETVEKISEYFNDYSSAIYIHSGFTQIQKEQALKEIENARALICDDSVLEYIDLEKFSTFINYDLPYDLKTCHKRMCLNISLQHKCSVINIVTTPEEEKYLYGLSSKFNIDINIKRLLVDNQLIKAYIMYQQCKSNQ